MRWLIGFAAATAFLCADPLARAADSKPAADREVQDIVYSSGKKNLLIRLHVFIDGKPLLDAWDEYMGKLFAYLDIDGDGVLSKEETARVPSPQTLFNPFAFYQGRNPNTPLVVDRITKAELTRWYRHYGARPFQFRKGPVRQQNQLIVFAAGQRQPLSANALTEKLFALLDADKDGKLDRRELARAPDVLRKLDADDDETVSIDEMSGIAPSSVSSDLIFAATVDSQTIKSGGPFALADDEKDGKRTPDVELRIRIGKRAPKETAIELIAPKDHSSPAPSIRVGPDGTILLDCGPTQIEFRPEVDSGFRAVVGAPRQQYLTAFRRLDRDKSGYLDEQEAAQFPLYSRAFAMMDRDDDGKLYEKEVLAYLEKMKELQEFALRSCVSLAAQDEGRGLFDCIDTDKDGRLSVRELRRMAERIASLDRDGDGRISREDIPRRYKLTVRRGSTMNNAIVPPARPFLVGNLRTTTRPEQTNGPVWFRKMDRNRDGDVSRREFLGSEKEFRRIDADGDSLISREEAERADTKWRKKSEP